jgi:hypothetical protein
MNHQPGENFSNQRMENQSYQISLAAKTNSKA